MEIICLKYLFDIERNEMNWLVYVNCNSFLAVASYVIFKVIQKLCRYLQIVFSWFCDQKPFIPPIAMWDFHDFGLIWVGQMHCLPQRLKSTLFDIFSNGAAQKGPLEWEKISNNVDFSLLGNRATTQSIFFDIFKWDQNHENHT